MINSISSSASTIAPYAPIGRQPVGLESTELKSSSLKALEQSAESAPGQNRRGSEYSPNQDIERDRVSSDSSVQERQGSGQDKSTAQQEQEVKEQRAINELATRDREVRAHEQAHASVGGQYAGSPTYSFERGPNGVNYAVGGEVAIDTSPVPNDPEATLRKAQVIRAAASAPSEPSPQDRRVASQAASLENEARAQIAAASSSDVQKSVQESDNRTNARKAEAKEQAAKEDELRKEINKEAAQQRAELDRSNQERAAILARSAQTTFDISRRLVEIGAVKSTPSIGNFLNSSV
ncbi:MAG: catalase [Sphingobacteriales bacterium]|nr:MAG: catalase [Sphingobacteriales bacterium]